MLSLILLGLSHWANAGTETFSFGHCIVALVDSTTAAGILQQPDAYTNSHTAFDLSIRLDRPNGLIEGDYLKAAGHDVTNWPTAEKSLLLSAFSQIDSMASLKGWHLHLPDTIKMIKTNCREEFGAEGYTRGNCIMLNSAADPISTAVVAHELWHVISRLNPDLRKKIYEVFHFKPCNSIDYKEALHNRVITNPDCPFLLNYATVEVDGQEQDVALVLYSKSGYSPGKGLMDYLNIGLLALQGDDSHKKPLLVDGEPKIYEVQDVPDFIRQVGMNTPYMLHIEEVSAEHFSALVTGKILRQMEFVTGFGEVLKQ